MFQEKQSWGLALGQTRTMYITITQEEERRGGDGAEDASGGNSDGRGPFLTRIAPKYFSSPGMGREYLQPGIISRLSPSGRINLPLVHWDFLSPGPSPPTWSLSTQPRPR